MQENYSNPSTSPSPDHVEPVIHEGLGELVTRHDKELRQKMEVDYSTQENLVLVVQGKIALEAVEDKILILMDRFRSGYECSMCMGTGEGRRCIDCNNGVNSRGFKCKVCEGSPDKWLGKTCPQCKGRGSTIIIPDSAKALPTSGTIVSAGSLCTKRKVGERVVFGAHVGFFLPFKGNVRLRMMREHEVLCKLYIIDSSAPKEQVLGDFLQIDEQPNNSDAL